MNATGSALLGLLLADPPRPGRSARVQAALTTGFCGGFTTFSTFSYELLVLLRDADYAVAAAYAVASVVVCTVGLAAGLSVRRGWQAW